MKLSRAVDRLFIVSPDQYIDFTTVLDGKLTAHYELYNVSAGRMAFKVQSNGSENYRVSPPMGFLEPGARRIVATTVRNSGNVDPRHLFVVRGLDICETEFWKKHSKIEKESYTLAVRAPDFNESRLRERLLTQVAALRQANNDLRKKIEALEANNTQLVGLIEIADHQGPDSFTFVHFAYSMLAVLLTVLLWDVAMAAIFADDYEGLLLEKGLGTLRTVATAYVNRTNSPPNGTMNMNDTLQ